MVRLTVSLVAALALGSVCCKAGSGDEEGMDEFGTSGGGMRAVVDGERWQAGVLVDGKADDGMNPVVGTKKTLPENGAEQLLIAGSLNDGLGGGTAIVVSFTSASGFPLGVYPLVDPYGDEARSGRDVGFAQVFWDDVEVYTAASGTLTLTSIDETRAAGRFEFTAMRSGGERLMVAEGTFAGSYASL